MVRHRCRPSTGSFWGFQMHYLCRMPRSSPMVACQIDGPSWCLFGDSSGVGMRRQRLLAAVAGLVMVAAGRAAEVAVFGERLPFSAAEVAVLVSGGDVRRGAADVFCGAADVRRQIRCALRRRAARPPIAPLTATAPPVGFAYATAVLRISSSNPMRSSSCAGAKTPSGPCGFKSVKGDS